MHKESLIGIREAIKKSWDLSFQNVNLGYYVKVILITSMLYSVVIGIIAVPMFFMGLKDSVDRVNRYQTIADQYQQKQKADLERLQRLRDTDYDYDTLDDSYLQRGRPMSITDMAEPEKPETSGGMMVLLGIMAAIAGVFIGMIQYNLSILAPIHIYKEQLVGFKELLGKSLGKVFSMLILVLIYAVIVTIGFVLFILPGIFFMVRFSFAPYIMLEENKGAVESLKASWELVKGYTLSVYLKMLGFIFLCFLILLVMSPMLAIGIYSGMATVFLYVFQLIFALFTIAIYFDLKRIKGGSSDTATKTEYGPNPSPNDTLSKPQVAFDNQNPYSPSGIS